MRSAYRSRQVLILLTVGILQYMVFAQSGVSSDSLRNGLYTAEQAERGKAVYQGKCGMCHGNALQGLGQNSPLSGAAFLKNWDGQTVADLFMKTIVMMPSGDPGTLKPKETAEVLSYILSANKFPAGKVELASDPQTLESNVPGIYVAGVIVAGSRTNEIFIENGRFHGQQIAADLKKKLSASGA